MTAEPRDVEEIREIAERYLYDGDNDRPLNDGYLRLAHVADRLATADRENAELRGEVNALSRVKDTDYQVIALDGEAHVVLRHEQVSYDEPPNDELMGSVGDMIRMLEGTIAERDDLRAQLAAAQVQLAEALAERDRVGEWINHYKAEQEAIIARYMARLEAVRALCDAEDERGARAVEAHPSWRPYPQVAVTDLRAALSAAPQPEPEMVDEIGGQVMTPAQYDAARYPLWVPPLSDEPARCEHGQTEAHSYGRPGSALLNVCPGPAASSTPDGGS